MIPLSYTETVFLAAIILLILLAIRGVILRKEITRMRTDLADAHQSLQAAGLEIEQLRQVEKRFNTFKADLNQAELATRMQKPRTEISSAHNQSANFPERYRYIHSLTEKGISSSDIASILTISPQEADQLVALASLRQS